jgi:hypothetical protein
MEMSLKNILVGAAMALGVAGAADAATLYGPIVNYLGFADSPFHGLSFSYFNLDTFEHGAGLSSGVTASAGAPDGPGPEVDSVEGPGDLGTSWFSGNGAAGVTFTFNKAVLGKLPTDVGIVWTDGDGPNRTFQAFDQNGASLGTIIDSSPKFFSSGGDGDFHNYRFFGAANAGGISSIFIANDNGGIEVDDLQFGALKSGVPEPTIWAMMLAGFGGLGVAMRSARRRQAAVPA